MDASSPISKLIESNSAYYNYIMIERVYEEGVIRDIYDGKGYRDFVTSLSESDRHRYVTTIFNTDGKPLFKSSAYSIWPIFLMVNELPFNVRSEELILVGLWFGKDKPNMNVFLKPFVESMNELSCQGVQCIINGSEICIKVFPLVCSVNSVARAPVQGFVQFNGSFGCGHCLHPGQWVQNKANNPRSGNIKYPILDKVSKQRNIQDTIKHMKEAVNSKKPIFGVKNPSQLINLLKFDIINGCDPDYRHCCSGIAKQVATQCFGNKQKAGLFPKSKIDEVDKLMSKIKAPNQLVRLPRLLSEKEFWKAREWENWTLFYSLPIFEIVLPKKYTLHWAFFVEAPYLLMKEDIQIYELDWADELLHKFVAHSEKLYSKVSMTFNMHLLLHLAKSVYYWGPLWAHSAFAFESGNGHLLNVIHAAKGVHHQICRRISLQYSYLILKDRVFPFSSASVRTYCTFTGSAMVQKTLLLSQIRYFGPMSKVNAIWIEALRLTPDRAVSYKKIVKNCCLYSSCKKNNQRSDNSFAQLSSGQYVKLNYFIVDSYTEKEYTIAQKVLKIDAFDNKVCIMLKKVIKIDSEESAVITNDRESVCPYEIARHRIRLCCSEFALLLIEVIIIS